MDALRDRRPGTPSTCPACGESVPPDARFCPDCYVDLDDASVPAHCPDCAREGLFGTDAVAIDDTNGTERKTAADPALER